MTVTEIIEETRTIKAERQRLGMTQAELAQALGLDVGTISRLERDRTKLKPWHWLALRGLARSDGAS